MKKIRVGILIAALWIPLMLGAISAALTMDEMKAYAEIIKPPLSPPTIVFPIAWTILYIMMGLASYFILVAEDEEKGRFTALGFYMAQLVMNFMWSIVFFNWKFYLFAFFWLIVMWILVIVTTVKFSRFSRCAAWLMIPYIVWLVFAAYLNMGVYLLNR